MDETVKKKYGEGDSFTPKRGEDMILACSEDTVSLLPFKGINLTKENSLSTGIEGV